MLLTFALALLLVLRIGLGEFALIALLAVIVAATIAVRVALGTSSARQGGRTSPTPPERELIADAKRPALTIGLAVLSLALAAMVLIAVINGLVSHIPSELAPAAAPGSFLCGLIGLASGVALGAAAAALLFLRRRRATPPGDNWDAAEMEDDPDWRQRLESDEDEERP